ncbi:F-box domain-containing protein [Caenorhabditis elegans]|uniref:F-box domain-containing protein n=1 Tax=Caenorhabditis elegans TaxID=6239 RepID=Q95XL2_CAEEL|nr:F-box domain-containing protein [Caenorhabditis elegans]CCD73839.2 F-box domain-containing protein [Caenorhabditis elegans]|eukprot:NP_497531.2 F-box A protein [Caenorhabditis elegans]
MCDSWWKIVSSRFSKLLIFKRRHTLQQKEPLTLLKLPMDIVNLVFEKMEPKELLKLRKVCTTLKTAVDKFGIHFNSIHFELDVKGFTLSLDDGCFIYIGDVDGGAAVDHCHRRIQFDGENFVDIGFKDLKMLLKSVSLLKIHSKSNCMIKSLIDALKPEARNPAEFLKVESIELRNFLFEDIVAFLSYFDTHTLKCIKLGKHIQQIKQFQQIAVLDQWKNAENFQIEIGSLNCISEIMDHICHFECFHINIKSEFPRQVAVRMRDDLMSRKTFQHCTIAVDEFNMNPIEIARVFKPDYAGDDKYKIEYSNDNCKFEVASVISDKAPNYPLNFSVRRLQKSCTH